MEIPRRQRYHALSSFEPERDEQGKLLCLNCNATLPKGRRKYCSDECAREFFIKHSWPALRIKIIQKSDFTCANCGFHLTKVDDCLGTKVWECTAPTNDSRIYYRYRDPYSPFVVDHIVPIYAGGPEFEESNLQALCITCNKKKTREDLKKYHIYVKALGNRKITEFCEGVPVEL